MWIKKLIKNFCTNNDKSVDSEQTKQQLGKASRKFTRNDNGL